MRDAVICEPPRTPVGVSAVPFATSRPMGWGRLPSRTRGAHGAARHLRSDAGADGGVGGRGGLECGIDVESAVLSTSMRWGARAGHGLAG
jgi:hypothetical protein